MLGKLSSALLGFILAKNILANDNSDVLDEFMTRLETSIINTDVYKALAKLDKQIKSCKAKNDKLLNFLLDGTISKDDFNEKKAELDTELSKLYDEQKRLQSTQDDEKKLKRQLQECREALETNPILKEFDRRVFEAVIDHVVIGERQEYDIILSFTVKIQKRGRNPLIQKGLRPLRFIIFM